MPSTTANSIYRWLVLATLGAVSLVVTMVWCLGHMGAPRHLLGTISHACLTAGHLASESVSVALFGIVLVTLTIATIVGMGTLARTDRFLKSLRVVDATPRLCGAVSWRGSGPSVVLVEDSRMLAFTAGWIRARVYISTAALDALDDDELVAVLAHERHHALRRDPWRLYSARVVGSAFFWLPVIRELGNKFELASEVDSDRFAVRTLGSPVPLARALIRFVEDAPGVAVAHVAGGPIDAERIRLLCDGRLATCTISARSICLSVVATTVVAGLVAAHAALPSS